MTLLRDMRLLLIVGLAILCLLALRLCSSEYQPNTVGSVTKTETAVSDNTASNTQTDTQGIVSSTEPDQSGGDSVAVNNEEQSEVNSDTEVDAESTVSAEQSTSEEESEEVTTVSTTDNSANDTGAEDAGATDTNVDEVTEAEVVDADAGSNEQQVQEEGNTVAESSDDASESLDSESQALPVEVVPSAIGEYAPTEVKRIVINAPAESGELIPDMKSDIESVKDGVLQFNEKLDLIDTLFEKVKNPTN